MLSSIATQVLDGCSDDPQPEGLDRRALIGAGLVAVTAAAPLGSAPRVRLIATEEAFNIPEIAAATQRFMAAGGARREPGLAALIAGFSPEHGRRWAMSTLDFGALRENAMTAAGINMALLLLNAPGVQIFDAAEAAELASLANDRVSEAVRASPARYAALAAIAPQNPAAAAQELQRAVRTLGLKGALINSHTRGEYLDLPNFRPILEAAQALDVPIYIHPRDPAPAMLEAYRDHALLGPIWGFAAETSLHALRLIMAGVFDDLPRLQIVLGHLGEGLPFYMDRIDMRYRRDGSPLRRPLKLRPSDYLRRNFSFTTSGMNFALPVRQVIDAMGADKVLFAADWPYEDATDAAQRFRAISLSSAERRRLSHANAQRIFRMG